MQEDDGIGSDSFFPANGSEPFVGRGFDTDLVAGEAEAGGEAIAHLGKVGFEFGPFGDDDRIDVANLPALAEDEFVYLGEELQAVGSLPLGIVRGEVVADITQAGGSEHGVHDGVGEDVGVAVADEAEFVVDFDATENEGAIGAEAVDVVAVADANVGHEFGSLVNAGLVLILSLVWDEV